MSRPSQRLYSRSSFVDPFGRVVFVVVDSFSGEPESDLVVGRLDGIGSVDDVSSDINAHISSDGSADGVLGSGGSEHDATGLDGIISFPDHGADGSRAHVFNERGEELLLGEIGVMSFHMGSSGGAEFHGDKLEALLLKSLHDLADKSSLDGIGLEHNESAFSGH